MQAFKQFLKKYGQWLLRLMGVLLLVYLFTRVDLTQLWQLLRSANLLWLLLAIVAAFWMIFFKVWRWHSLIKTQGITPPFWGAFHAYLSTYYLGLVTPSRAGEIVKAFYLTPFGLSIGRSMVSVLVDRIFDVLAFILMAILGVLILPEFSAFVSLWVVLIVLVLMVVAFFVLLKLGVWGRVWQWLRPKIGFLKYLKGQDEVNAFMQDLKNLLTPKTLLKTFLLTLASLSMVYTCAYTVAMSLAVPVGFWYLAFSMMIAGVIVMLPFSIGGLGLRDAALVTLLGLHGISEQTALAFSLLYFGVVGILLGVAGAIAWYSKPVRLQTHASPADERAGQISS